MKFIFPLTAGLLVLLASTANAQTAADLRRQLNELEAMAADQPEMAEMMESVREMVRQAEEDERLAAAEAVQPDEAAAPDAPPPAAAVSMRRSYFAESGRADLERCTAAGDLQIDSLCSAAMARYGDYRLSLSNPAATSETHAETWRRHELTARAYLQALDDFRSDGGGLVEDD